MLGDLHIHMILDGIFYRSAIDAHKSAPVDRLIRQRLEEYRQRGAVFLRDGGDRWGVSLRAKELAAEYGIDYRSPAFPIHKAGHYGGFIGRGFSTWREYEGLLDEVEGKGGDFVKLMISGLIDFSGADTLTEESLPKEDISTMIRLAHRRGFAVMAHANGDEAVNAALEAGVDSIEHGAYLSTQTLQALAASGAVWVPTLSTIGNLLGCGRFPEEVLSSLLRSQQEKVALAASLGGKIGLGSDAGAYGVYHGRAISQELSYLKAALGSQAEAHLQATETYVKTVFLQKSGV